jgi:hypothetical protein
VTTRSALNAGSGIDLASARITLMKGDNLPSEIFGGSLRLLVASTRARLALKFILIVFLVHRISRRLDFSLGFPFLHAGESGVCESLICAKPDKEPRGNLALSE